MCRLAVLGGFGGWLWWRAMRCSTGHCAVGVLGSQAQHVQGTCWESWGTSGRSPGVMWCLSMAHCAPRWMMVVCVGLGSFGASNRVTGGTLPVTGGTRDADLRGI